MTEELEKEAEEYKNPQLTKAKEITLPKDVKEN